MIYIERPARFPDWRGQPAAVIASGPSANRQECELLRGRVRTIAVNRAFELAPWADALYGCDPEFWTHYKPDVRGLKICEDAKLCKHNPDFLRVEIKKVNKVTVNELVFDPIGQIGGGGNGGFQAFNIAVQTGANPILLLFLDMAQGKDGAFHFHAPHPKPLKNPRDHYTLDKWRVAFQHSDMVLKARGIRVINCTMRSTITVFRKMGLIDALAQL